jgi:hypothetical protein
MQRFSTWARWILGGFFTLIILPLVGKVLDHMAENYGWYDREALPNAINVFLGLAEQTWFRTTALMLGSFLAGMLVDWLLRRLDVSRAKERQALGIEMRLLAYELPRLGLYELRPKIMSCLLTASKLGIWVPDQRVVEIHPDFTTKMITDYLIHVGTLLKDEHFIEAKR